MTKSYNSTEELRVFVYGTLKPGEANHQKYCQDKLVEAKKAIAQGKLFTLPVGYPAMTLGDNQVHGYLLRFTDFTPLTALDNLEDYHPNRPMSRNLYNRQSIKIFQPNGLSLGWAWAYLMTVEQVNQLGGIPQLDGCWNS